MTANAAAAYAARRASRDTWVTMMSRRHASPFFFTSSSSSSSSFSAGCRGVVGGALLLRGDYSSSTSRFYSSDAASPVSTTAGGTANTPGEIFKTSVANKTGLSHALDGVMRSGEHDMRVFGTGTLAALASKSAYAKFAAAHYHFYAELERALDDAAAAGTPSGRLWSKFADELRRAPSLENDLVHLLGTSPSAHPPTPAVANYVRRIAEAADKEIEGGAGQSPPLLVAHFYTRYLADLFGGSMVRPPPHTRLRARPDETHRNGF